MNDAFVINGALSLNFNCVLLTIPLNHTFFVKKKKKKHPREKEVDLSHFLSEWPKCGVSVQKNE